MRTVARKNRLPVVAVVASDYHYPKTCDSVTVGKSLVTTTTTEKAVVTPTPKGVGEGRESSLRSLSLPPDCDTKRGKEVAAYAGAISRWCDLTGNVPEVRLDQDKIAAEFAAFNHHLDELASEARRIKSLQF